MGGKRLRGCDGCRGTRSSRCPREATVPQGGPLRVQVSPEPSDETAIVQAELLDLGVSARALQTSAELGVATATRQERQQLKELEQLLRRNQKSSRNIATSLDEAGPDRARMLLRLLPVLSHGSRRRGQTLPGRGRALRHRDCR